MAALAADFEVGTFYVAFAGASLNANVFPWTMPSTLDAGSQTISGVGFSPELLLLGSTGHTLTALPGMGADFNFKMSAAHRDGSQWVSGSSSRSGSTSNSARWQLGNRLLLGGDLGSPPYYDVRFNRMTPTVLSSTTCCLPAARERFTPWPFPASRRSSEFFRRQPARRR